MPTTVSRTALSDEASQASDFTDLGHPGVLHHIKQTITWERALANGPIPQDTRLGHQTARSDLPLIWRLFFMLNSIVNAKGVGALATTKKFPTEATHCLQSLCDKLVGNMGVVQFQVVASLQRYLVKKKVVENTASAPKSLAKLVQRCLLSIYENQLPLRPVLFGLDDTPLNLKKQKRRRRPTTDEGDTTVAPSSNTVGCRTRSASRGGSQVSSGAE